MANCNTPAMTTQIARTYAWAISFPEKYGAMHHAPNSQTMFSSVGVRAGVLKWERTCKVAANWAAMQMKNM